MFRSTSKNLKAPASGLQLAKSYSNSQPKVEPTAGRREGIETFAGSRGAKLITKIV